MVFHMNHPPRPRNRRVIGWHLVQSYPQKVPQPQRIRCPPRYPPFAVDALEISDQQQAEIPSWRQTGPPHLLRVEARTLLLHVLVKAALLQQPVQLLVERMPHRPRQLRVRDPQFLLSSLLLFSTHSHAQILRISAVDHTIFFLKEPRLSPRTASAHVPPSLALLACGTRRRLERDSPELVRSLAVQRDSASQHDYIDGCQNRRDNYPDVASRKILGLSVRDGSSRNVVLQPQKPALTTCGCRH